MVNYKIKGKYSYLGKQFAAQRLLEDSISLIYMCGMRKPYSNICETAVIKRKNYGLCGFIPFI